MNKKESGKIVIGLFGTCGRSTWREQFIETYNEAGIDYFNPQVPNWKPEFADIEAEHLASDEIILFPVTSETYATGSLSEVGFSILNAIRLNDRRDFVIFIDMNLDDDLQDEIARKESLRARALVKQHLKKLNFSNVYIVENLEEMLSVSLGLYQAQAIVAPFKRYTHK